jgi:hypothetical protein
MLGMTEVHALASGLESRLKRNEPLPEGFLDHLERAVGALAARIAEAALPGQGAGHEGPVRRVEPDGPLPEPIRHLLELLAVGDGASATAIAACLDDLHGTAWQPRLERALVLARRFDFAAAHDALLTGLNDQTDA